MSERLEAILERLRVMRNSHEDAIPELLEWAVAHIEALNARIQVLDPIRSIGGVLHVDVTEDEVKGE